LNQPMPRRLTLLCVLLSVSACGDLVLLPEPGRFDGTDEARVDVLLDATAMPEAPVEAVELQLGDVLVRRAADQAWVVLSRDQASLEVTEEVSELVAEGAPIDRSPYDLVRVTFTSVRVAVDGTWSDAAIESDLVEIDAELDFSSDRVLVLHVDVDSSLSGSATAGWEFVPVVAVDVDSSV